MLAVAGGKGGVGKTTTTLGLAGALARDGRPVRAVDTDSEMPDLHALAGCDREPSLDAVLDGDGVPEQSVATIPGVRVVAAPRVTDGASVSSALARLRDRPTFVDTPAGAGPDAVAPLRVVDHVLLVADGTPQALRDAAKTAAIARQLGVAVAGVVLVGTRERPEGVERLLETPVLGTVPAATDPLSDPAVWRAYDGVAGRLRRQTVI
ncbi:MinD/ParA family ATP-binding protein [Haloarchaeobius iranensis]|uniref:Septum site-determining protein MinD n=1 Tax=Haloarchaeobius iranensis TaxID=996166 RepID=A0A1G9YWS2_9EURY|nr:P-loop NTPase [Haloarchaeobius iranensis]SDN12806.1 septum site-determining protein MinD [Haloarchaeobius iranensis]